MLHPLPTTAGKMYISLMSTLDLSHIARLQRVHIGCRLEHKYLLKECGCIDRGNATQLVQVRAAWGETIEDRGEKGEDTRQGERGREREREGDRVKGRYKSIRQYILMILTLTSSPHHPAG